MKNLIISFAVGILVGGYIIYKFYPNVKKQIEIQEKEVVRNDIRTIVKEVIRPDGSKETTTEIVDKTKKIYDNKINYAESKLDWLISANIAKKNFKNSDIYGLQIQRRILGPIFIGLTGNTNKEYGISVGFEF